MQKNILDFACGMAKSSGTTLASIYLREAANITLDEAAKIITALLAREPKKTEVESVSSTNPEVLTVDYQGQYSDNIPEEIQAVQSKVLDNISKPSGTNSKIKSIMSVLVSQDESKIKEILGEFGDSLIKFSKIVYADHPSLIEINNGTLLEGGKVYNRVNEALQLVDSIKEKGFKEIPEVIKEWFATNHKNIMRVFSKPPARIVADQEKREACRNLGKPKDLSFRDVYDSQVKYIYDTLPDDLSPYVRMGNGFDKVKEFYNKIGSRLKALGLVSCVELANDTVQEYNKLSSDKYMGFVKVKMHDIGLIASKLMKAQFRKCSDKLCLPTNYFKNPFWERNSDEKSQKETKMMFSDVIDKHVLIDLNYPQLKGESLLNYAVRVYPLNYLNISWSQETKNILNSVEHHVDVNNYPLFDNLWIIVPTVFYNSNSDSYYFCDGRKTYNFYDYWQFCTALDSFLIKTKQTFPILVGENTSTKSCYFISYLI